MERPALFVGDAEEGEETLKESEVRQRMKEGLPPESAEEYLLRVRIESNDLPAVVEAHVPDVLKKKQTLYMPLTEPMAACPAYLLPTEEWEREVLSTFVDLRQYLRRWKATAGVSATEREPVPALKDSVGWHIFCVGFAGEEEEDDEEGVESEDEVASASGSALLSFSREHIKLPTASGTGDPRHDDDAQSRHGAATTAVESGSRFDRFSATLSKTSGEERKQQVKPADCSDVSQSPYSALTATTTKTAASSTSTGAASLSSRAALGGAVGPGKGVTTGSDQEQAAEALLKRRTGKDWLQTHPRGTPPTLRLAIQFDQVLTQKVLAFHAEWLRDNLLSRARAVWIYTLLACLEKPLGSETAALVREILRRCCSQRAEVESPLDDNLPALNIITAIAGRFFQQAEAG